MDDASVSGGGQENATDSRWPDRPDNAHKGTFGTVIVIGGSTNMIGAPALTAGGALRGGAGLVRIAAPSSVLPWILSAEPCATGVTFSGSVEARIEAIERADPGHHAVLAIGPGLGHIDDGERMIIALMHCQRTIVLDADGLNLLAKTGQQRASRGNTLVMTPHPGEFERLARSAQIRRDPTDPEQRVAGATELAVAHDAVVALKGQHTVVSDGKQHAVCKYGNPALATAGTGDVLTGLIAALLAQGMDAFEATRLAVDTHALAGDLWHKQFGPRGLTAKTLLTLLPRAMAAL